MPSSSELAKRKKAAFDPIFAKIAATRVIAHMGIRKAQDYDKVVPKVIPIIEEVINPELLAIIEGGQAGLSLEHVGRRADAIYIPENMVRSEIRKLVDYFHSSENKKFNRQLTESCLALITSVANDKEFADRFYEAVRKSL